MQGRRAWLKRTTIVLPLLCLIIFGTVIGVRLATNAVNANAANFAPIKGQVPALVKSSTLVGPTDTSQSLSISVGLQLRNTASLRNFIANTSRPKSITAHQHLTSAQIAAGYAPLSSSQQAVIAYLQGFGFQVTTTGKLHLTIGFKGTVGDAESAFHLQINNYHSPKGQNFYAPASDPSVPANLAALIQNISGLDNAVHLSHPPINNPKSAIANALNANATCIAAGQGYFLPTQIATAYNLAGYYNAGYHGEGQRVALLELDNFQRSDINAYTACYGGSSVPISTTLVDGGPGAPSVGANEVELDMELILSAAPKLANLEVYEAPNDTWGHYMDLWSQIISDDSASVISTSWGACEAAVPSANLQEENNLFAIAAAQGQNIFAASGDEGTNDCRTPIAQGATRGVDDPASQPYVTGVGGTTLTLNSNNTYKSETVWNNGYDAPTDSVEAGGGGISNVWPMPSWQQGPGVNNSFTSGTPCGASSGNCREVPDVSLNADPNTGYLINCSVQAACAGGSWWIYGGTSAAAPMWAAAMSLTNEKTLHDGGFNIGFVNPYLYQIDQNAGGTSYANDFHDTTTGNNDGLNDGQAVYPATTSYDQASGLGSYNAFNLGNDLETLATAQHGSRGAPANTTWYFAEGSVGGTFQEYITLLNPSSTAAANVSVTYLFENQSAVTVAHTVPASSRFTINVNADLNIPTTSAQQAISAIVTSTNGVGIVAERPMYFNWQNIPSGTDVVGATDTTHTTFYFAQGDTTQSGSQNSSEFITILNPSTTQATNVTATFYSNGQVVDTETISVAALHRGTIIPQYKGQAAIKVSSDLGVVVERPIYFNDSIPNTGSQPNTSSQVTGAASTVGATSLGTDWLFAEGHTADRFQEDLVLANFTTTDTTATIKLEYTNGSVQNIPVTVNAQSQLYFDVNNAFQHPVSNCNCTPTADVSAEVTATSASIVAERIMYFHYQGPGMTTSESGGTDVVGEAGPSSHSIYSFAEGYTTNTFQEWLTLQNPNATSETIAVTFFADSTILQQQLTLPAHSRTTIYVNNVIVPMATAYPGTNGVDPFAVSISVQVNGAGSVVVERPIYFNYFGSPGGTDVIGYTGN